MRLEENQVSNPVLTRQGVVLVVRRAAKSAVPLSARTARFGFFPDLQRSVKGSREDVMTHAVAFLGRVAARQYEWDEIDDLGMHPVVQIEHWDNNRAPAELRHALESSGVDEVHPRVVQDGAELVVLQRLAPERHEPSKRIEWLPSPGSSDIVTTFRNATKREAEAIVADALRRGTSLPDFGPDSRLIQVYLLDAIEEAHTAGSEDKVLKAYYSALERLKMQLGSEAFGRAIALLQDACDASRMEGAL